MNLSKDSVPHCCVEHNIDRVTNFAKNADGKSASDKSVSHAGDDLGEQAIPYQPLQDQG